MIQIGFLFHPVTHILHPLTSSTAIKPYPSILTCMALRNIDVYYKHMCDSYKKSQVLRPYLWKRRTSGKLTRRPQVYYLVFMNRMKRMALLEDIARNQVKLKITDSKRGSSIGWHPSNQVILLATGLKLQSSFKPSVVVKLRKDAGKSMDSPEISSKEETMVKQTEQANPESLSSYSAIIDCNNDVGHLISVFLDRIVGNGDYQ